jgi:hypothetical protein
MGNHGMTLYYYSLLVNDPVYSLLSLVPGRGPERQACGSVTCYFAALPARMCPARTHRSAALPYSMALGPA